MFQLISSMEELQQCRVQQRNIATTIDKLTHCLPGNVVKHGWCSYVVDIFIFGDTETLTTDILILKFLFSYLCFSVLEMYGRLQEQMRAKRYATQLYTSCV